MLRYASMKAPMHPPILYGTAWKELRTAELVLAALNAGYRGIDTANQRRHYFESGVGQALATAFKEGIVERADLFLQTKFTYRQGQDNRMPYNPNAPVSTQVAQSVTSSLQHLGTDYIDSFLLHGPSSNAIWTSIDMEAWQAMVRERQAGRVKHIGVSNVSISHLEQMSDVPSFVQNRCFASTGWDREVRSFCSSRAIVYQGFSLLTANVEVLRHPIVQEIALHARATIAQIIFAFAQQIGILPLTGTTDPQHLSEDLESLSLELSAPEVEFIETLAEGYEEKAQSMGLGS